MPIKSLCLTAAADRLAASAQDLQAIEEQTRQQVATPQKAAKAVAKKRQKNARMDLPADLPRQEVVIHPAQDLTDYVQIGEEVTEVLEITPPAFWVKRIVRTKWALKDPQSLARGILMAPIPSRTVAKGLFRGIAAGLPGDGQVCRSLTASPAD